MSLEYIRKTYNVPAKRGGLIRFINADTSVRYARILSGDHLLHVRWEDDGTTARLHPTWMVWYVWES